VFFYLFVYIIVIIDQALKILIHRFMALGQTIPLIKSLLNLTYVRNTGAAFSLFVGFSPYLVVVGLVVVAAVIFFHHRFSAKKQIVHVALAFILAGSIGNLLDRFFRGYVIDYIDIGGWPVFNFADIMINVGVILFLLFVFEEEKYEREEEWEEKQFCEGVYHTCCDD